MAERSGGAPTPTDVLLARTLRRAAELRRRRRAAMGAAAVAAAAALALPLATLGAPPSAGHRLEVGGAARPGTSAAPGVAARPGTSTAPGGSTAPGTRPAGVAAPACRAAQLQASFDHREDGSLVGVAVPTSAPPGASSGSSPAGAPAGSDDGTTLVVTNQGPAACTLRGAPAVTLEAAGHQASGEQSSGGQSSGGQSSGGVVTLAAGGSAGSVLRWQDGAGVCVGPGAAVLAALAGGHGTLSAAWEGGSLCGDPHPYAAPFAPAAPPVTSDATPAASGLCATAQLQWIYLPGGSDTSSDPAYYPFEVVNVSSSTCATGDYPGASASDTGGAPLFVATGRRPIGGAPVRLTLVPGGVASFALTLPDTAGRPCSTVGAFHFIAPNDQVSTSVAVSGPDAPRACGAGTSTVGPLHPGLGVALQQAFG